MKKKLVSLSAIGISLATLGSALVASGAPVVRTAPAHAARPQVKAGPLVQTDKRGLLVAGGATLPFLAYMGNSNPASGPNLAPSPRPATVFGYVKGTSPYHENITYCQTGSGFGRKVASGADNVVNPVTAYSDEAVNLPCPNVGSTPATQVNGFGTPTSGITGFPISDPDLVGTDAPLGQSDYTAYVTNKHTNANAIQKDRLEPVQIPYIVGSIAILYNNPDIRGQVVLKEADVCNIFNGTYTNWNQIPGLGLPSRALTFVVRADGSGTSFGFSNRLQAKCGSFAAGSFSVSQQFFATSGVAVYPSTTAPANLIAGSGNGGVSACVASNTKCLDAAGNPSTAGGAGSIGYVEAANAKSVRGGAVNFAKVGIATGNVYDPLLNLPETANRINSAGFVTDQAVATNGGAATLAPLTGVAVAGCVATVNPARYNALSLGYPYIAVSNLIFGYQANGNRNASTLKLLAGTLSNPSIFFENRRHIGDTMTGTGTVQIQSVDAATQNAGSGSTGYSTLPPAFESKVQALVAKCING